MLLALVAALTLQNTYPRAMEITRVEENKAYCIDAVGMEWTFTEPEDLEAGDLIICTMYDNGTTNTIVDDEIVDVVWSGYYREDGTIKAVSERRVTNGITQGK